MQLWKVPVAADAIPETGRHFFLSADASTRTAIATHLGVRSVEQLEATYEVTRRGRDGLHVVGQVKAVVGQSCVVTLEPIDSDVVENVDVDFIPAPPQGLEGRPATAPTHPVVDAEGDPPELLVDGAIDPYPRKPGAKFVAPTIDTGVVGPFAALAKLKPGPGKEN
jgi:hypothetical protein